ncbi:MAG: helix-turn-helix transcriptional regulator [Gammaproteobacteria bacterium]
MSRAQRLLELMEILRRHRYPVTGAALAGELGVSLRSLYRDIATLQENGASIDGAPGLGYVLRPGFTLPPMMLTEDEIESLVLGSRWVSERGDARLAAAARNALAKISAVLPPGLRETAGDSALLVGPGAKLLDAHAKDMVIDLALVRQAIRAERKIEIDYCDIKGETSVRTLWPLALGFFDNARIVVAWCELRAGFRHFRADRIARLALTEQRYPRRRNVLIEEWRAANKIPRQG